LKDESILIIANPCHSLGFLAMTDTEPIGFNDPVKALIVLERLRKQEGNQLKLYQTIPVIEPLILKSELETYIQRYGVMNFDYDLIKEYLKEEK